MATDLGELTESLRREIAVPGAALYDADDDFLLGCLQDGFWEARLDGLMSGHIESDGAVVPDLARDMQQIVVLYAGIRIVRNHLRSTRTAVRSRAGKVAYEVEQSAAVLREVMVEMRDRRKALLARLTSPGPTESFCIDAVSARESQAAPCGWWDG